MDSRNPYGMNYIHLGSYTRARVTKMSFAMNTRSKTVTMPAFYIDVHEISNNEYRQFCEWVKDLVPQHTSLDDNEDYFR